MRWPSLVKRFTQSMPVEAVADVDGIDEDGAPVEGARWRGKCNWQDATVERYMRDKAETEVFASVYIDGDAFPTMFHISGGVVHAFGEEHTIVRGSKGRNPDGTVNFTHLEVR